MPRKCVVKHCQSNVSGSPYTPTFTIPKEHSRWSLWKSKIRESSDQYLKIIESDTVCIKHFEERFVMRSAVSAKLQRAKLSLTKDAYPTLDLASRSREQSNETELTSDFISQDESKKLKAKRGSCGLANLQKARMKKQQRRERMKNLIIKRAEDRRAAGNSSDSSKTPSVKRTIVKVENTRVLKSHTKEKRDFFLSDREPTNAEQLLVSLRLTSHFHNKKICKDTPSSINDANVYPTFNIIKQIEVLNKNPVTWTVDETCRFVRKITASRAIGEVFKSHGIDGEALMSLGTDELQKYLSLDALMSETLGEIFSQLRREVVQRYTFI